MTETLVVGILAAVGGGAVAAFVSGLFQSPKTKAEAAKLLAEQGQTIDGRWEKLSNELEERLSRERAEHRAEIEELRAAGQRDNEKLNSRLEAVEKKLAESEEDRNRLRQEVAQAERTIGRLRDEVTKEKRVTRTVIGWAITMRDELVRLGGTVPEVPKQVEDYLAEMNDPPKGPHGPGF